MRIGHLDKGSVSARIIKIAILAVAIGITTIIIAVSTGKGLQKHIENKTATLNSHIVVSPFENSESQISVLPITNTQEIYEMLKNEPGVTHVQKVAIKAGLLKSEIDFDGIVFKGVSDDYKWESLKSFLVEGSFPEFTDLPSEQILISQVIANRLSLSLIHI